MADDVGAATLSDLSRVVELKVYAEPVGGRRTKSNARIDTPGGVVNRHLLEILIHFGDVVSGRSFNHKDFTSEILAYVTIYVVHGCGVLQRHVIGDRQIREILVGGCLIADYLAVASANTCEKHSNGVGVANTCPSGKPVTAA